MSATTRRGGTSRELAAHRDAVNETLGAVAKFLVDLLGVSLVAYISDVDESTVRRWTDEGRSPRPQNERRLRGVSQIARLLLRGDANHTVRAWFIGMNPQLDDESPAEALRADRLKDVMAAARAFMDGA